MLLAILAAILWGVWWIPIRQIEAMGVSGVWAGMAMSLGALPLLVLAVGIRSPAWPPLRALFGAGLLGAALSLYASSLTETTIVRAVLLFYLAPGWSIALECLFFRRRWSHHNSLSIITALAGIALIFRGDLSFENWGAGDSIALFSGVTWACGSALTFTAPNAAVRPLALSACAFGLIVGAITALALGQPPSAAITNPAALIPAALLGITYFAPVVVLTLWCARILPPGVLSFLLTGEILSGILTSAYLLDDPFGWPEALGALLVVFGALGEVFSPKRLRQVA